MTARVPLHGQPGKSVVVEHGATKGAVIGRDLYNADGTLFDPASLGAASSEAASSNPFGLDADTVAILQALSDIASDNVLTPAEKSTVIADVTAIQNEQSGIDAQATAYGITTEKTAYDNAVATLNGYLGTLTTPTAWNSTAGNTDIVGATFRAKFTDVYAARQALLNKIAATAKVLADTAGSTAQLSNYAKDGSFEGGGTNWFLGTNAGIDTNPVLVFFGQKALVVSPTHTLSQSFCQMFRVNPGDSFVADCMLQSYGANGAARLIVWGYDINGGYLGVVTSQDYSASTATYPGTSWRAMKVAFKVPANVLNITVGLEVDASHTTGYWSADLFRCVRQDQTTGNSANLLWNTDFGGENGSKYPWDIDNSPWGHTVSLEAYRDTWVFNSSTYKMRNRIEYFQSGVGAGGSASWSSMGGAMMPVVAGGRYEAQVRAAFYRCSGQLYISWYDSAGTLLSQSAVFNMPSVGGAENVRCPLYYGFVTAPASAATARYSLLKFNTDAGQPNSVAFFEMPYFGVAAANQVEPSQFSPGAVWSADQLTTGSFGVVSTTDLYDGNVSRRIGLRVPNSGHRVGDNRNLPMIMVGNGRAKVGATISYTASAGAPATATISVSSFNVTAGYVASYSASSVGVTGTGGTAVLFYLYMDDAAQAGGARTLVATTNGADLYASQDRLYIGDCTVTFPTSGSGSGGGGRDPGCVCVDMWIRDDLLAGDVDAGCLLDVVDIPADPMRLYRTRALGNRIVDAECVRLVTDGSAALSLSADTPFDTLDGRSVWARDLLGELVITDRGIERVASVTPIGVRPVARISAGGVSFAAGEDARHRIYSHNTVKP